MREIDELEASNTKRFVLGIGGFVLIAAVIGVVFFRSKGTGAPEEDHRILIVSGETVGLERYASELGFEALSGTLEAWQSEVAKHGEDVEADVGLDEVLAFADRFGYGYVVLEQPQRFADELDALDEVERPAGFEQADFAVLSVGDFAGPHELSVEPSHERLAYGPGPNMLGALFAQSRLQQARDPKAASSEIQGVRLKLDDALSAIDNIEQQATRADELRVEIAGELDGLLSVATGTHAKPLQEPLVGTSTFALADGRVLLRSDRLEPVVYDSRLKLRTVSGHALQVIPADAPAQADARRDCPELPAAQDGITRIELSAERDAMVVIERGGTATLLELDANAGPCGLRLAGSIVLPVRENSYVALGHRAVATREVDDDGALNIDVYALDGEQPISVTVREPGFRNASSLVWLDASHVVVVGQLRAPEPDDDQLEPDGAVEQDGSALVFVDLEQPERAWVLPLQHPTAPERQIYAHELQRIVAAESGLLLRWSDADAYTLSRLDFPQPWSALLVGDAETETGVLPLPTWTTVVSEPAHIRGYDIDLRGQQVAYSVEGDLGVDVAVAALPSQGGTPTPRKLMLDDSYEHREVSFRPGHDELLFRTRLRITDMDASLLVAHALVLGSTADRQ